MSHVSDIRLRAAEGSWENCSWPAELASGFNIYAYVGSDPLNGTDPSGLENEAYGRDSPATREGNYTGNYGGGGGSTRDTSGDTATPATTPPVNSTDQGVANFIADNPIVGPRFFRDYSNVTILRNTAGEVLGAAAVDAATLATAAVAGIVVAFYPSSTAADDQLRQFVIRGGLATPENLMAKTGPAPNGLTGFSGTSAPGMTVDQLAREARYPNGKISSSTVGELAILGYPVAATPLPGQPLHVTVVTPSPLPRDQAEILSKAFAAKTTNLYR